MKKAVLTTGLLIVGVFGSLLSVKPPYTYGLLPDPREIEAIEAVKSQREKDADWARYVKQTEEARIQREEIQARKKAQEEKDADYVKQEEAGARVIIANRTRMSITVFFSDIYHDSDRFTIESRGKKVFKEKDFGLEDSGFKSGASDEDKHKLQLVVVVNNGKVYPEARKDFILPTINEKFKFYNILERSDNTLQIIETE